MKMHKTIQIKNVTPRLSLFRTYATKYFPCLNLFNTLHTVLMHGLSIYELKRIWHRNKFFIISRGSFQHLTDFLISTGIKYHAKIIVTFSKLLSFYFNLANLRK